MRRVSAKTTGVARQRARASRTAPGAQRANQLMELATVAAQAHNLDEFLERFSERVTRMLPAEWCGIAVTFGHHEAELFGAGRAESFGLESRRILALAQEAGRGKIIKHAEFPGSHDQRAKELVIVPVRASGGEPLGAICAYGVQANLVQEEAKLLQALASHAALSLDNFRRFSQLERSKQQWVQDIDAISDFIVVHDREWKIVRTNRSLADHLGLPPVALVGEAVSTLRQLGEGDGTLPCPFCLYTSLSKEEHILTSADKTYLVSTSRASGSSAEDARTIHVLKDITDRREAERRYRELYDSIQEGLFFATPDGKFLDVNDAMVRMLGYASREELLRDDVGAFLYPEPHAQRRLLTAIRTSGVLRNHEQSLRRKDGRLLHTLQNVTAVRDTQGNIKQFRGLMLDVTDQKMFQAQLQRERDFNQKILNATQSMILVLDTAGLVSYANRRCFEAGYKQAEIIGRRLVDLVEPGHQKDFEAALDQTARGDQVENLELRARRSDGSMGHFSISLSPMRDEQGAVNSVVVVMTDITDAALMQAKLAHAERMATLGRLVSGVAHEVNNPLAAILGFTDLLLENTEVPVAAKEDLKIILHETQRTKDIVQDLLSFARQRAVKREFVQVETILRQTIKLRSYDLQSHGVEVFAEYGQDVPTVMGDAQQLQQVFLNILNNAYDAIEESGRRGTIRISAAREGEVVEITLADNGIGIGNADRIFDPFYTTKPTGKGTGLGLSICYGIVRAHGGEIQCWNNADGLGSTFAIRLPVAMEVPIVNAKEAGL